MSAEQDRRDQWRATMADKGIFVPVSDLEIDMNSDDALWGLLKFRVENAGGNLANDPIAEQPPEDVESDQ